MSNVQSRTYEGAKAVVKSDTVNDGPWAALWIGGAGSGNLTVTMMSGEKVTFTGVTASGNEPLTFAVLRVWSTGTDVTGIIGLKAMPYKPTTPAVPST